MRGSRSKPVLAGAPARGRRALARGLLLLLCSCGPSEPTGPRTAATVSPEQQLAERLRSHVTALAVEIGERNAQHPEALQRASAYIHASLEAAGYQVADRSYRYGEQEFRNVEALLASRADAPCIVVGAHYDSVQGSPGADDNASGVAVMIEVARRLRPRLLRTPVRFVAFANEEPPYFHSGDGMGSVEYLKRIERPAERIRFMLSLESVGYYSDRPGSQRRAPGVPRIYPDTGNFIAFVSNPQYREPLLELLQPFRSVSILAAEGAALPATVAGVDWSDHRSFWEAGIPAAMVTDTAPFRDPSYHRAGDTAERLDYRRMGRLVEGLAHSLEQLGNGWAATTHERAR